VKSPIGPGASFGWLCVLLTGSPSTVARAAFLRFLIMSFFLLRVDAMRLCMYHHCVSVSARFLSPSTAVYIPIDACCTYVSTSYIPSTSSTTRVASGYGDLGPPACWRGAGTGCKRGFPPRRGAGKSQGQRQNPRELCWPADLSTSRSPLQGNVAMIHRAMALSNPRLCVPASITASGINWLLTGTRAVSIFCCPRDL
jgi:hypothetical protein